MGKKNSGGMAGHENPVMQTDVWLTPPEILAELGDFDLDPCASACRPWDIAKKHYTKLDDGFNKEWKGRVYCNPPYGRETKKWLKKLAKHGEGIALIFARTETKMFFDEVWGKASGILFLKGRLCFYSADGTKAKNSAGAPSVLVSYGKKDAKILKNCSLNGYFVSL